MLRKLMTNFRERTSSLRSDENGMEAAQVILILVIVVIALIPLINLIVGAITSRGQQAANLIKTG